MPAVPVLVLSGDLDANAPSAGGRRAAAQFARASFAEIPNAGHTPTSSPCALELAQRFVAALAVDAQACARTGTPPPIARRAPVRAVGLRLAIARGGTRAQRRALALVLATVDDLVERAPMTEVWGATRGLRGGRYVLDPQRAAIRLDGVRVVRDGRVSGVLALTAGERLTGRLQLSGPGVVAGRLRVRLAPDGSGRASGVLGGRAVDLAFR